MKIKAWLPAIGLTFAAFVFNTSEFVPIGLLSDIARDFNITEAHAGLLISIYAWVVALMSLPLMLAVSKVEYRKLLFCIIGLFLASHVLSAMATSYPVLMISRIGVACSHSIFWSIASPLAVQVAPEGHRSTALGLIVTGTSVAMIVGLPLGRVVGLYLGWRMTFLCIAVAALLVLLLLMLIFPKVKSASSVAIREVPRLFRNKALIGVYFMTVVIITAQFTGYSYIEPFLAQVAGFDESLITFVLILYGAVGLVGSILFSKYYDRHPVVFIKFAVIGIAVFLFLLYPSVCNKYILIATCVLWGFAVTIYNLVFQSEIIQIVPKGTSVAMSAYSGIYNLGIGSGALVGGLVCTHMDISQIGYVGGWTALFAVLFCLIFLVPLLKRNKA